MTNNRTTTKVDDIWLKASSVACSSVPVPATEPLPSDYFQTLLTHAQPSHSHYALGVCLHSGSDWYLGLPCIAKISQASVIDSCNPWISIRPDLKCCCALLQCFCPSLDACHTHANCMWTYSIVVSEHVWSVKRYIYYVLYWMWMATIVLVNSENVHPWIPSLYFSALTYLCL